MNNTAKFITLVTALSLSACSVGNRIAQYGENVSTTLGNINVNAQQSAGKLTTTNGNIVLGINATAKNIEVVNGNVELSELNQVNSIVTVNGNIEIGQKSIINGDIETLNGNIDVSQSTQVTGNVITTNGNINLTKGSQITGDIIFEKRSQWLSSFDIKIPELKIEQGVEVAGLIHLYQEVKFDIVDKNLLDKVVYHYQDNKI